MNKRQLDLPRNFDPNEWLIDKNSIRPGVLIDVTMRTIRYDKDRYWVEIKGTNGHEVIIRSLVKP